MMRNLWSRLRASTAGLGAVEFGLIAPVLLTLLLGILDYGMAFWEQMEIADAADAGAQWGMQNSYNASSIQSVAQSATALSEVSVGSSNPCGCATLSGVSTYSCSATCPDGSTPKPYIVVNTNICYATLFKWPGLSYCTSSNSACSSCTSRQISLGAQSVVLK